jgi:hypothetical protein
VSATSATCSWSADIRWRINNHTPPLSLFLASSEQRKTDAPTRRTMKEEEQRGANGICARMWNASVSATLLRFFAFRGTLGCA